MIRIGHRGACGSEPENTLRSFRKAIQLKVDMVECDAHLTKDNQVVIIHDDTVDRTTNGKGKVSELTLKELKKLNIEKKEKIPTLEEVISVCKNKCKLNVEVKGVKPAKKVTEIIVKDNFVKQTIISSNHKESLLEAKKKGIKTALIYWATKTNWGQVLFDITHLLFLPITKQLILKKAKEASASTINLAMPLATKSMINFLHKNKLKVNVWTVNKKSDIEKIKKRNADGCFSNFPERI
jgi:glycerophosphoryl diester phosphodiesterase